MERRLSCMVYLYILVNWRDWVKDMGCESSSALGNQKTRAQAQKHAVGNSSW